MKTYLYLFFSVINLFSFSLTAQTWNWVSGNGSTQSDIAKHIGIDGAGNTYVVGTFRQTIFQGGFILNSNGGDDIFIAKYDPQGNLLWTKSGGGTGNDGDYSLSCKTDSAGNTYIITIIIDTAYFSQDTLTGILGDIALLKYDTDGNLLLSKTYGGIGNDSGSDIDFDKDGNIYITGQFTNSIAFGFDTLTCFGTTDIFIAKLNNTGIPIWAKQAYGSWYNNSGGIVVDKSSSVYLTGYFSYFAIFGSDTLTSSGDDDAFFVKYNSSGDVQWAKSANGTGTYDMGNKIDLDGQSNLYVSGQFENTLMFDTISISSNGQFDGFIAKLDSNGNFIWVKDIGGNGYDIANDISVLENGDHFITGVFSDTIYIGNDTLISNGDKDIFVLFNNEHGVSQWTKQTGGNGDDRGWSVESISSSGDCFVAGNFSDSVSFDAITLQSNGDLDFFVGKINSTTTGVFSFETNRQLIFYPNPSTSGQSIYFKSSKEFGCRLNFSVTDMIGKNVFSQQLISQESKIEIEIGYLSAGVYIINLLDESGSNSCARMIVTE